jgi:trehalose 6-phosphate synthase
VNAVEPLLGTWSGVWVGHGAGSADRETAIDRDGLMIGGESGYRLRRIWLSEGEERGYYDGFANSGLWPLCHRAHTQPVFRAEDFEAYQTVNARFADAVGDEADGDDPVVLVQDYHFALAPQMIRERLPHSTVVTFWHIPWPHWQTYGICPQRRELMAGLLGSDILGFQTAADCQNFIETAEQILGIAVDRVRNTISYQGRRILVRHYPASIEWPGRWAAGATVDVCRYAVRRELRLDERVILGVGVDRLDFTKGIEEKFLIIEQLLESHPQLRERFVFVQLAHPTRRRLAPYRKARLRLLECVERINRRFSTGEYQPILLLEAHHNPGTIARYFRAADVCFVNSLHDGMNLVTKEFVAARDDEQGVLVLSEFAGAACELTDAVLVNPYDARGSAAALAAALTMSSVEQRRRMRRMREVVSRNAADRWASRIVGDAMALKAPVAAVNSVSASRAFA